jgi:protein TorT
MHLRRRATSAALLLAAVALSADARSEERDEAWYPVDVDVWEPAFNTERARRTASYVPLEHATEPWRICVSIPHLKDEYWTAVNFGLIDEARRLGVRMQLYEAGGYGNLETQRKQLSECMESEADGIILSAISAEGLNDLVAECRARGKPVIDLINGMTSPDLSARAAADYWDLGNRAALYLRTLHEDNDDDVRVAWFPGPEGAAWVAAGDNGFREGIAGSSISIVAAAKGDTGRAAQAALIEAALDAHTDLDYIVGTTVTAEAAVPVLRKRGLTDRVKVISYYYSPGVHRGITRGQIVAAPSDSPVIQARIAVDQLVRALEDKLSLRHVAPKIVVIDRASLDAFDTTTTLPPRGFRPIFSVNEW